MSTFLKHNAYVFSNATKMNTTFLRLYCCSSKRFCYRSDCKNICSVLKMYELILLSSGSTVEENEGLVHHIGLYWIHCKDLYNKVISCIPLNRTRTSSWISDHEIQLGKMMRSLVPTFGRCKLVVYLLLTKMSSYRKAQVHCPGFTPHKLLSNLSVSATIIIS